MTYNPQIKDIQILTFVKDRNICSEESLLLSLKCTNVQRNVVALENEHASWHIYIVICGYKEAEMVMELIFSV
jgi:hypothetical protein